MDYERELSRSDINGDGIMTIEITLTKGMTTIVDDEDSDLRFVNWCFLKNGYAVRGVYNGQTTKMVYIHRTILSKMLGRELSNKELTDHINGDKLDNRRENLRVANNAENTRNQSKSSKNTSGYKGVFYKKDKRKWCARIKVNYVSIHLGYYGTPEEAHKAYCEAADKYFGEFANYGE